MAERPATVGIQGGAPAACGPTANDTTTAPAALPAPPADPWNAWEYVKVYAALGWRLIPVSPHDKAPLTQHGYKDASGDLGVLREWYERFPRCGWAVANGAAAGGPLVIDLDRHEGRRDGVEFFEEWLRSRGLDAPGTLRASTPSGGGHIFLRACDGAPKRSIRPLENVDVLGDGGYTVLPPTSREDGGRYEWQTGCAPWERALADAPELIAALREEVERPKDAGGRKGGGPKAGRGAAFALPDAIPEGGRNDVLYKYGCSLRGRGKGAEEVRAALEEANATRCAPPLPPEEVARIAGSVLTKPEGSGRRKAPIVDELRSMVEADPVFSGVRLDTFRDCMTAEGLPWNPAPHEWNEGDDAQAFAYMQRRYGASNRKDAMDAVLIVALGRSYSSLVEELEGLPQWDGQPRAADLFADFLGADNSFYNRTATSCWMCGAVERAFNPGVKFDNVVVLIGPQGCGKSSLASLLGLLPEFFTDSLGDLTRGKDTAELMRGKWIIELPELTGMRGREVNAVKAFITRTDDVYRPAYGKHSASHPRMCAFIGTANPGPFLADATGNRRFWPIRCGAAYTSGGLDPNSEEGRRWVEQAWAEIVAKRRDRGLGGWGEYMGEGEGDVARNPPFSLLPPPGFERAAAEVREGYEVEDPFEGPIADYLEGAAPGARVCARMLAVEALGMDPARTAKAEMTRIAEFMDNRARGWERMEGRQRSRGLRTSAVYGVANCWQYVGVN